MNKSQIKGLIREIEGHKEDIKSLEEDLKHSKDMKYSAEKELYSALAPILFGDASFLGKTKSDLAKCVPDLLLSMKANAGVTLAQIIEENFE